jgi:hypothetical protein
MSENYGPGAASGSGNTGSDARQGFSTAFAEDFLPPGAGATDGGR